MRPGNFFHATRQFKKAVDEGILIVRAARGDEKAFAELYARHQGPLYRYALHMCPDAADDVVQEAFLAVIQRPEGYDASRGTVAQYLFGIARRQVHRRIGDVREPPVANAEGIDDNTPLDELIQVDSVGRVRAAVDALPPVFREVVVLCDLQEMTYQEAAAIVGCPVGTLRSRLHRARARLANRLAPAPAAVGSGRRR